MFSSLLARLRPRLPRVASHGEDESYAPAAEGCDLLGTGVDHLRAYLTLHPAKLAVLLERCEPVVEEMRAALEAWPDDGIPQIFPATTAVVTSGSGEVWEGLARDLLDATAGGPGLTNAPLIVLMSKAIATVLYDSDDNGLLYAASAARTTAARLDDVMPSLMPAVTELVLLSRDAIGLRAARVGLDSVLLHRRVPNVAAEDVFRLQRLTPLSRSRLADPEVSDLVRSIVRFRTLSVWASDLPVVRDWAPGEDPGTQSSVVLSIRVPVTSLWFAPRSNDREFLISPDGVSLEHVEVLHRV
ncbi:hypothetical protein L1277_000954 [Okibacterium sp. HSC-33S16]|uniref:hypothetical protein n=1 Tax=Okibacterium sp. HSC-33S16 TaxID=2910965 RepID=UPI00209C8E6E|nr:hypothetical protein [Okibacterium sp. HSC-33S16]MCP2030890.1 hypothetical protein [Okibacterium sp. HSC-33S16]